MCGRFVVSYTYDQLLEFLGGAFDIFDLDQDINVPRYNIAPGQNIISVIKGNDSYRAGTLRWGLVPHWSKDEKIGYKMINARSETLTEKPSFRDLFKHKRCVILADGFYEWKRTGGSKQPMYIQLEDKKMFLFAGLWTSYTREDGTKLFTTTIITTRANKLMSDIHDRMPCILSVEEAKEWLNPDTNRNRLFDLLEPRKSENMTYYPVSDIVNNAKNDVQECIEPINPNLG